MKILDSYLITDVTIALFPLFTDRGEIFCIVFEATRVITVKKSPLRIIQDSILTYGGSYRGALKAAKHHLGNRYMLPIKISGFHRIYLIPDQSPRNENCVWMAIHHIHDVKMIDHKQSRILFTGGKKYTIRMKEYQFNEKLNRARKYQQSVETGDKKKQHLYNLESGCSIIREGGNRNFNITFNKDE